MDDDLNPPGTDVAQTAAPATQPTAPAISPEVEAIIAERERKARDSAYAQARRELEGRVQPKKPKDQDAPPAADAHFDDALLDAVDDLPTHLTKEQRRHVRDLAKEKRPSDVRAYVTDMATRLFPSAAPPIATNASPKPTTSAAPTGRPASDAGAPAGAPNDRPTDVTQWTSEDIERFYAAEGMKGVDIYDPRNGKIHRKLRDMARTRLANMRFALGPRGGPRS